MEMKEAKEIARGYIGYAVHGYRNPNSPTGEETVTKVVAIGSHQYQPGNQGETAIKAATDRHPRPRWYVGYGGDFVPASKNDLKNIFPEQKVGKL